MRLRISGEPAAFGPLPRGICALWELSKPAPPHGKRNVCWLQPEPLAVSDPPSADLEPAISAEIMQLHHSKHHQTYINNLVAALERHKEAEMRGDLATQISLHNAIKFNGGGE